MIAEQLCRCEKEDALRFLSLFPVCVKDVKKGDDVRFEFARGFRTFVEQAMLYTGEYPPLNAAVAYKSKEGLQRISWQSLKDVPLAELNDSPIFPFQIAFKNAHGTYVATPPIHRCTIMPMCDMIEQMEFLHGHLATPESVVPDMDS